MKIYFVHQGQLETATSIGGVAEMCSNQKK